MNGRGPRAWRFVHPALDASLGPPGLRVAPNGGVAVAEGNAAIRQAVLLLLSTKPGERVMRPEYGCDLHRLLFSPNDATTAGLAIHYVRTALRRWEPRIEILTIDAVASDIDPGRLDVHLEYRVIANQVTDRLVFPIDIAGSGS